MFLNVLPNQIMRADMQVVANGKLILSGEHAVVYGNPALAMTIDRQVVVTLEKNSFFNSDIFFQLPNLKKEVRLKLRSLQEMYFKTREYYLHFLSQKKSIRDVIKNPEELLLFSAGLLYSQKDFNLPFGIHVHVDSTIPVGAGMGSSAATILALMFGLTKKLDLPFSQEKLFELALQAENMQHGRSSGLDLQVILQGGAMRYEKNSSSLFLKRPLPDFPLYLIHTGIPENTTGECVMHAAPFFKHAKVLKKFSDVTNKMDHALKQTNMNLFKDAMRENHYLLCEIGVVPRPIQELIFSLEKKDMAAKICGAGAVSGNAAGMLLVCTENKRELAKALAQYDFTYRPVQGVEGGVHVV